MNIRSMSEAEINAHIDNRARLIERYQSDLESAIAESRELQELHAKAMRNEIDPTWLLLGDELDRSQSEMYYEQLMATFDRIKGYEDRLAKLRDNTDLISRVGKTMHDVLGAVLPEVTGQTTIATVPQYRYYYPVQTEFTARAWVGDDVQEFPIVSDTPPVIRVDLHEFVCYGEHIFIDYDKAHDILFLLDKSARKQAKG